MGKRGRGGSSFSRNGADQGQRGGRNNGYLDFSEDRPFGVGNSRLAYRCRVCDGCYRGYTEGSYCIFKVFKPTGAYDAVETASEVDVEMQVQARVLAERFNNECAPTKHGEPCEIHVRDAALGRFEEDEYLYTDSGRGFQIIPGDTFLLERQIRGAFEKFSSNSGWNSGGDPILEAFSHWTWSDTGGHMVVCDLQGHRGNGQLPHLGRDYYYLLTDPAVCTHDHRYGESDLGQAGIDAFFANHTCNEWCRHLDIDYERPAYCRAAVPRRKATSYHSLI